MAVCISVANRVTSKPVWGFQLVKYLNIKSACTFSCNIKGNSRNKKSSNSQK